MSDSNYLCPSAWDRNGAANDKEILRWTNQAVARSEAFLKSQRAWADLDLCIDIIAGGVSEKRPKKLSRAHVNQIKIDFKEIVATLSNIRPMVDYKSDNPEHQSQTTVLNKLYRAWYLSMFVDRWIKGALQYAGMSKGYLELYWDPDAREGTGDIGLKLHGPRDVLPVGLPPSHDLQKAYAVAIRNEVPIYEAQAAYPEYSSLIVPDRNVPTGTKPWVERAWSFLQSFGTFGAGNAEDIPNPFPTVDIFHIYIRDGSLNMTDSSILMGEPDTSWSYTVPSFGSQVPTGLYNESLDPVMRRVTRKEAMLYPNRRLIVCTKTVVLYDGPSYHWHGRLPLVSFELDKWAWEFLGYSLVKDSSAIQESATSLLRAVDDAMNRRLRPFMIGDSSKISEALFKKIDPRAPGSRVWVDLSQGASPIQFPIPPGYDDVPPNIQQHIEWLYDRVGKVMGKPDLSNLHRAAQIPAGDSIEKLAELAGPLVQDMGRGMEASLRDLGELFKWMVFQWYTTKRRVQLLGPDGITEEDYDFDPGNLIPDEISDRPDLNGADKRFLRAKEHAKNFRFHIVPNSMHQITQTQRKLLLVQIAKAGVLPLDWWTLAEALDINNFGPPPIGTSNIMERWKAQKQIEMEMASDALQMQQGLGTDVGGRPPSFQRPPELEQKDGGQRTTITTS
jgi:hypothetical protein